MVAGFIIRTKTEYQHGLLLTKPLHHSQKETLPFGEHEAGNYGEVRLTIEPNRELRGRTLLYGENLEVITPSHYESRLRRFLEGKCSNILKINSKISFKTTALSKKCSIFAALFLMKDEYQGVHQPERRIYILSRSKGEIPIQPTFV